MRITLRLALSLVALAVLVSLSAGSAFAQFHPAYLHALSDLRTARAHLEERPDHGALRHEERDAIEEINRAIDDIKRAAIRDGKDIEWHPPVDLPRDWAGRLRRAMELLNKAYNDIDREEDNEYAQGLRNRSLGHIGRARQHVREALEIIHERYE
jgi:hypothetical protein